jgi:hypothetical protein
MQPVQSRPAISRTAAGWYIAGFIAVQVLVLLLTFMIPSTQWFLWHDHYPGLRNMGYSQRVGRIGCQILIYGDSSSVTGMDPAVVQAMTGLKTCNVSEGTTVQEVVGSDVPLQAYLQHNASPRFLLGTWTPSIFRPHIASFDTYTPEGAVYAMQFGERRQLLLFLLRHPNNMVKYSIWVLQSLADGVVDELNGKARHQIDARAQRSAHMGQWPYPLPPETHCVRTAMHYKAEEMKRYEASVDAFRRKYSTPATTVIVNMSPVPICDQLYDVYAQRAVGLHDNSFDRLPISDFNEGDVHFSASGSRYISEQAGRQILALMNKQKIGSPSASGALTSK